MANNNFELKDINFGFIIEDLLGKGTVTDIEIRPNGVWITDINKGRQQLSYGDYSKEDIEEFKNVTLKMPYQLSHRMKVNFNEGDPILDGEAIYRDEQGNDKGLLRINAIDPSLTGSGIGIAIRLTTYDPRLSKEMILKTGYASKSFLSLMEALIYSGCNTIFAGITGAGKTEALKYFARHIPINDSIITIEDTREAYLELLYPDKDVLALKSTEKTDFEQLIRASLRQNPDWILVSEARGREVLELNEAVGTGHKIITTIHSDGVANIPYRMTDMAKVDGSEATRLFRQIHNNIDLGVYIHYYNDEKGSHRQVTEVAEYYLEDDGNGNQIAKQHMIYEYDFKAHKYKIDRILSPKIIKKLTRSEADTSAMEVFLNAKH